MADAGPLTGVTGGPVTLAPKVKERRLPTSDRTVPKDPPRRRKTTDSLRRVDRQPYRKVLRGLQAKRKAQGWSETSIRRRRSE